MVGVGRLQFYLAFLGVGFCVFGFGTSVFPGLFEGLSCVVVRFVLCLFVFLVATAAFASAYRSERAPLYFCGSPRPHSPRLIDQNAPERTLGVLIATECLAQELYFLERSISARAGRGTESAADKKTHLRIREGGKNQQLESAAQLAHLDARLPCSHGAFSKS